MRIGITCYPTYGGSGAVATELGLDLARRGHHVHFITYASPFRLRGYAERVFFHEVDTRMGRYPLFDHFPYTLALASRKLVGIAAHVLSLETDHLQELHDVGVVQTGEHLGLALGEAGALAEIDADVLGVRGKGQ